MTWNDLDAPEGVVAKVYAMAKRVSSRAELTRGTWSLAPLHAARAAGVMPLYRVLAVPRLRDIDWSNVGSAWASLEDGARAYFGAHPIYQDRKVISVRVVAQAALDDVDFDETAWFHVIHPAETEVVLKPGTLVTITALEVRDPRGRSWVRHPMRRTFRARVGNTSSEIRAWMPTRPWEFK